MDLGFQATHPAPLLPTVAQILDCQAWQSDVLTCSSFGNRVLSMLRKAVVVICLLSASVAAGLSVSTIPAPRQATASRFEVALVKPVASSDTLSAGGCHGSDEEFKPIRNLSVGTGACHLYGFTLKALITIAYLPAGLNLNALGELYATDKVVGGPSWANTERFEIEAKSPDPPATHAQLLEMLQGLLVEQFKLKFHRESRDAPGYELIVAKDGPKLKEAGPDALPRLTGGRSGATQYEITGSAPISRLVAMLTTVWVGAPISDLTGLTASYEINLKWTPDESSANGLHPPDPAIFTALPEQLGLKLEARKLPVDTFVIDSTEKPAQMQR